MIGKHLLCMNLFREADGSLHITTSGHSKEFMREYTGWSFKHPRPQRPIDYAEELIVQAAKNLPQEGLIEAYCRILAANFVPGLEGCSTAWDYPMLPPRDKARIRKVAAALVQASPHN